jgi:uncharacterized small protein (DUF1192 family)
MEEDAKTGQSASYLLGEDLARFSLEELTVLDQNLELERQRVQTEITRKSQVKSAADSVFR